MLLPAEGRRLSKARLTRASSRTRPAWGLLVRGSRPVWHTSSTLASARAAKSTAPAANMPPPPPATPPASPAVSSSCRQPTTRAVTSVPNARRSSGRAGGTGCLCLVVRTEQPVECGAGSRQRLQRSQRASLPSEARRELGRERGRAREPRKPRDGEARRHAEESPCCVASRRVWRGGGGL